MLLPFVPKRRRLRFVIYDQIRMIRFDVIYYTAHCDPQTVGWSALQEMSQKKYVNKYMFLNYLIYEGPCSI